MTATAGREAVRRLLLIVNPQAQRVNERRADDLERLLSARFDLKVVFTESRGHATDLARDATEMDVDGVAVFGGDGTVNEVVNSLARTDLPLAIIPGGGANVLPRSLGIPRDPWRAAAALMRAADLPPRRMPLGRADGRYFTCNCGVGFDAAIVRAVERHPEVKRRVGDWFFVWVGLRLFAMGYDRRHPRVHVAPGRDGSQWQHGVFFAIVQNVPPFTFLGRRALQVCPESSMDGGLDWLAMDRMSTVTILPVLLSAFSGSPRHTSNRHVTYRRDQEAVRIRCDRPMPFQADGEYVGERMELLVESVPDALSIIC